MFSGNLCCGDYAKWKACISVWGGGGFYLKKHEPFQLPRIVYKTSTSYKLSFPPVTSEPFHLLFVFKDTLNKAVRDILTLTSLILLTSFLFLVPCSPESNPWAPARSNILSWHSMMRAKFISFLISNELALPCNSKSMQYNFYWLSIIAVSLFRVTPTAQNIAHFQRSDLRF